MNDKEQTDHKALNLMLPAILQAITTDDSSRVNDKPSNQVKALFNFPVFRAALTDQNTYVGAQAYQSRLYVLIIKLISVAGKLNMKKKCFYVV